MPRTKRNHLSISKELNGNEREATSHLESTAVVVARSRADTNR